MAQTFPRKALTVFGKDGGTSNFGQFGSQAASAPLETKDVIAIQALAAWADGWQEAVAIGQAPYLQDMNAAMYVHSYMLGSIFDEGMPEYDASTIYSFGSVVKLPYTGGNNFQVFVSLGDANTGNALPTGPASNAHWQFVFGFVSGVFTFGVAFAFGNYATQGIIGTPTNNDAAAGKVGEYVESIVGVTNFTTTAQFGDLTSIALTAGDWDVSVVAQAVLNGATMSSWLIGASVHPGNDATGLDPGTSVSQLPPLVQSGVTASLPTMRFSLAAPATIYLKYYSVYAAGNPQCEGRINARRVR